MIRVKNKQKLAIAICIIVAIIICSGIGLAVYIQNKPQQELQVSTINNESPKEEENILDVEEIVTEENVQEINEEDEIPQQEEIKEEVKEETSKENETTITKKTNTTQTDTPYYIKINYKQNVVTVYAKDEKGNYTKPIKAMVCSCGTATPKSGTYSISSKYKWGKLFRRSIWTILYKNSKQHTIPFCAIFDTWR